MGKSSRVGFNEVNIGTVEFPQNIIDSFPITIPTVHNRAETILSEAEQDHTPSHKQYQVS